MEKKLDRLTEGTFMQRTMSIMGYQMVGGLIIYGVFFLLGLLFGLARLGS